MKKLFSITMLVLFGAAVAFAQESFQLYKFNSQRDAEKVLKALNAELKLNAEQYKSVEDLLFKSAQSQVELYAKEQNKDVHMVDMIVTRNTRHIEGNLQNILGEKLYKTYNDKKAAITKAVQTSDK